MTDTAEYPNSIQALLARTGTDWGDPTENRVNLVPYGINFLDQALYGIARPEIVLVQGDRKGRKTTFAVNVLLNYMTSRLPEVKPVTNIETLESGMRPGRYRDTLIANLATRFLLRDGHTLHQYCPKCGSQTCREAVLSPNFLVYNTRSKEQAQAIEEAWYTMNEWPLFIHGPGLDEGASRNLTTATNRWKTLVDEYGVSIFFIDHIQQYTVPGTDYEKQLTVVPALSDFSAEQNVTFLALSQLSMSTQREHRETGAKLTAAGGAKAAQEANTVLSVKYKPGSGYMRIGIEESRNADTFAVYHRLDDSSGAFYGSAFAEPPEQQQ